jgi:hypothetical protein
LTDPVFWSLGFFRAEGYAVTVGCPNGHAAEVDLDKAIALLGAELRVVEDRARFLGAWRCRACGARGHDLTIQPPGIGTPGGGHSMS